MKFVKINILGASWTHLVSIARKFVKRFSVGLLGAFGGHGAKMLKITILGAHGAIWWPRRENI